MTTNIQGMISRKEGIGRLAALAIATSAAMIVSSIAFTSTPASADTESGDSFLTSQEVADALQNVQGDLVQDPLSRSTSPISGASATDPDPATLAIEIPDTATDGVTLSVGDFTLGISLPNAEDSAPGEALSDGTITYPSEGASANAVIPTGNGVQLLSVIEGSPASETYSYDLSLPAEHRLEATADGGARIVDEQNTIKVEFEPAWAQDAVGKSVPTRYAVEGNTLTQIVEHKNLEGVSYPVVADPLPVIVIVITAAALIVVAAAALGIATWIVVSWWNTCRAQNKYPELSTKNGFTARCVR